MPRSASTGPGSKGPLQQANAGNSGASLRALERQSGSAAAREAEGRRDQEEAKRKIRNQRGQAGFKGARSRGP